MYGIDASGPTRHPEFIQTPRRTGVNQSAGRDVYPSAGARERRSLARGRSARDVRSHRARRLAVATVGAVLMLAGGVAAKPSHCRKDCRLEIANCLALVPKNEDCTGTRVEKRACRRMDAGGRATGRSDVKVCKHEDPCTRGSSMPTRLH